MTFRNRPSTSAPQHLGALVTALVLAAALAVAPLAAQGAAQTAKPAAALSKTMAAVQGAWLFTHVDGNDISGAGQEIVVTISEDKYVQTINGQVVERGTFKIDDTKKPWTIDLSIVEGEEAGKTQLGVLQLTDSTMVGKLSDTGLTTRPTDFAPSDGAFVFTAVKKK